MNRMFTLGLLAVSLSGFTQVAMAANAAADAVVDKVVDKVVMAYGGKKLTQIKSIKVVDQFHSFRGGQSVSPAQVDLNRNIASVVLDVANQRNSFRWVVGETGDKDNVYTQHQVFDGVDGLRIEHGDQTISRNPGISYTSADRRQLLTLDTHLALLLSKARGNAKVVGKAFIGDAMHDIVEFQADGYQKMTVYVSRDNGYVSRLKQPDWLPNSSVLYNFSNHTKQQGIVYAENSYVSRGGEPQQSSVSRTIEFNADVDQYFQRPKGFSQSGESLDFSTMTVKKLADNVYLAGQHWGFSVFVDVGDHFIGAGGYIKLKDRFAAVQKFASSTKPLKFQVVSHHHTDHLAGMKEAVEMGVTLVAKKAHVERIRSRAEVPIADERFLLVDQSYSLAGGKVKIIDVPNGHSTHNLVTYFADAKTIFTADMYASRAVSGVPDGYEGLVDLKAKMQAAGWQVEHLAAAHSGRVMSAAQFEQSLQSMGKAVCPQDWQICKGYN